MMLVRFANRIATLLLAGFLAACLIRFAPGFGVDEREMDARLSPESLAQIRAEAAAHSNVFVFYAGYLRNGLRGDLGESQLFDRPVMELLRERLPLTAQSVGFGWLIGVFAGILCAVLAALPSSTILDGAVTATSGLLLCLPAGVLGLLLFFGGLPVAAGVAALIFPKSFLYVRSFIREGLAAPHVLSAHARGVGAVRAIGVHVLLPSARTLLALFGVTLTLAFGASVPIEVVCDSPGIGQLAWQAAQGRDLVLLTGLTLFAALVTITANSLAELTSERWESL